MGQASLIPEAEKLVSQFKAKGLRLALIESCTGGALSAAITAVPGSSALFAWGLVLYDHNSKHEFLGCDPQVFIDSGSVSAEAVAELAAKAKQASQADVALAISGIAGPGGGSADKPVGTCWVGICADQGSQTIKLFHPGDRQEYRRAVVQEALGLLNKVCSQSL